MLRRKETPNINLRHIYNRWFSFFEPFWERYTLKSQKGDEKGSKKCFLQNRLGYKKQNFMRTYNPLIKS
jgi:hypothetical protein